jgi:autotransporter translocation and assembly factor TamB
VDCQSKYDKNIINIEDLILKVADSKIAAQGTIEPKSSQGQFKGAGFVDVKDIKTVLNLFNLKYPLLDKVGLSGIINGKFIINGGKNPSDWEVKLAALSQNLKFYNITAKDVSLELYRNKNELIISPLRAEIGEGKIDLRVKIDSTNNRIVTNILVNDLNLAEFKKDLELKDTNLSGRLSLEANIENDSLTQWNKLNGEGKISIEQGNIWEINLLRGLGNMLFIPEFESIVFEEGHSDLIFKDENVVFDNIELKSYQMTLRGRGRISLKGDIDFAMVSEFNPNLVSASESLKKFFTNLLGQNALAIELNGTLKKPNYKIKPVLFSNLGNVQDLLENILK